MGEATRIAEGPWVAAQPMNSASSALVIPVPGGCPEAAHCPPAAPLTPAQLHALNDQIMALRQISIQLHHAQSPGAPWAQPWKAPLALPAPDQAAHAARRPGSAQAAPGAALSTGSSAGKRKAPPLVAQRVGRSPAHNKASAGKPQQGKKQKKAFVRKEESEDEEPDGDGDDSEDSEEPDAGSMGSSSDEDGDAGADVAAANTGSQPTPQRRSGRRRSSVVNLRDPDSDDEEAAAPDQAQQQQQNPTGRDPPPPGGGACLLPAFQPLAAAAKGKGKRRDEEAACAVCGDGDQAENNAILLCDGKGCRAAAHQACYGVAAVPEGEWRCDGCAAGLDPRRAHCLMCPVAGGALRAVASLGAVRPPSGRDPPFWVHLACALWVPEVTLASPEAMSGVRLDALSPDRNALACTVCKQAGGGVIQCAFGRCARGLHPLCARGAGHLLTLREADGAPLGFCALHSGERFARTRTQVIRGDPASAGGRAEGREGAEREEGSEEEEGPNEYEAQRARNIERNRAALAGLLAGA